MSIMHRLFIGAASALLVAASASATVITFDEFPAANTGGGIPANLYSSLGVTFQSTDDGGTIGGISNGDPGNWDLEGTNGPQFAGFNGSSYSVSLLFASDIVSFSLDGSRSNGSSDGVLTIEGFLNGLLISTDSVAFGAINQWSTVSLAGLFDQVTITGTGTAFHPFGVDNINFTTAQAAVPEPGTWAMMLLGFGAIGFALRRSRSTEGAAVRLA